MSNALSLEKEVELYSDNYFFLLTTIRSFGLSGFGGRRSRSPKPPNDN